MEEREKKFILEFFKSLKCSLEINGNLLKVSNVPRSFEEVYGIKSPYEIDISNEMFIQNKNLLDSIRKYLEISAKNTLLKIDFDIDVQEEISKRVILKNCEIKNIVKKNRNNFFSRFTFMTNFRYLNESEQITNEIYVYRGKVINGDLSGYKILEGKVSEASTSHLEKDYSIAKDFLKVLIKQNTENISETLKENLEKEVEKIKEHYSNLTAEISGGINSSLEKIKDLEEKLRTADSMEFNSLALKLEKLKKGLAKIGNDDEIEKISKEQEFTIQNAQQKHSLNIENKLINTTVIYYPVFVFNLLLKSDSSIKSVEVSYDPLTRDFEEIKCESCGIQVSRINLCSFGHISCDECFIRCRECGSSICKKCSPKSCSTCGKVTCKGCSRICLGCGKNVCKDHLRKDCVTGDERCVSCLRACMRCHGLSNPRYFGEALDGSKVCQKCLGEEKRRDVMKSIFKE